MAKKKSTNNKSQSGGNERSYVLAGILLAIFGITIMLMGFWTSISAQRYNSTSSESLELLADMSDELRKVNENVLEIVSNVTDMGDNVSEITVSFDKIEQDEAQFEVLPYHSDAEMKRYHQAKIFMAAYRTKLNSLQTMLSSNALDLATMKNYYNQDISPLSFTASEMLESAKYLNNKNTRLLADRTRQLSMLTSGVTIVLLIIGEIAIIVAARLAKRRREDLERKTKQAEAAANKFKHSQQKMEEIAFTNILTNMKNRYALDNDIGPRLDTDQFNIALFDMDGFKIINDTYGYDFGDEYLAQIAEKLKAEYSNIAELYNITGNSFAFVFNKDVSDVQSTRYAQNILMTMTGMFTVANLNVQLTASGCIYHYIPGDCQNLSGLLVKMDNVIRNAKRSGGNAVFTVDSI
ncbi:MAG: GGDEF domain-containing protein [Oscillospiraceae bacterium]|nr:GGDEF domain-containing protein [Oscillospiraceae bacterium]